MSIITTTVAAASKILAYKGVKMICVPLAIVGGTATVTHHVDRAVEHARHAPKPKPKRVVHHRAATARAVAPAHVAVREKIVTVREECAPVTTGGSVGGGGYIAPWGGWPPYAGSFPGTSIFPGGGSPGGHGGGGSSGGSGPGRPPISVPGTPAPGSPGVGTTTPIAAPVPEAPVVVTMAAGFVIVGAVVRYKRRRIVA
jgi:hypothetical protein